MRSAFFATIALVAFTLPTNAVPAAQTPGHELESRATQSSQGWYSYGCYMDCYDGMNRFLPTRAYKDPSNSPDKCVQACKDSGFDYAGLQFGDECWCGHKLAGPPTKPEECHNKCTDGKNKCGGPCRNNIWSAFRKPGH